MERGELEVGNVLLRENHPNSMDVFSAPATKFLCDAGQVT